MIKAYIVMLSFFVLDEKLCSIQWQITRKLQISSSNYRLKTRNTFDQTFVVICMWEEYEYDMNLIWITCAHYRTHCKYMSFGIILYLLILGHSHNIDDIWDRIIQFETNPMMYCLDISNLSITIEQIFALKWLLLVT